MNKKRLNGLLGFPADRQYKKEIEAGLCKEALHIYKLLCYFILLMQGFMLVSFLFKEGGPFLTTRRTGYFILYLIMVVTFSLFLLIIKRYEHQNKTEDLLKTEAAIAVLLCVWSIAITSLDQYGGNGLIVYCYMLPTIAVFCILKPWLSITIFSLACLALNLLLPSLPGGMHNLFSNLVNSIFITLMSIVVSISLYHYKVVTIYNNIIMKKQMAEIKHMNETLNRLALTDQLTLLYNRRYLNDVIYPIFSLPQNQNTEICGIMLDIDYFKEYNDSNGHPAGDNCLKEIANQLMNLTYGGPYFAVRFGGEEFLLILMNCSRSAACAAAEQIIRSIHQLKISHSASPTGYLTLSAGISHLRLDPDFVPERLVDQADRALYQAKKEGKNCYVVYNEEPSV